MNVAFTGFVASAKVLAANRGLQWDLPCDEFGRIPMESRWDLTALAGMMPPPSTHVADLGVDQSAFLHLNEVRRQMGQADLVPAPMSTPWRDLYLAVIIDRVLVRKNRPSTAVVLARWIRHLASAAPDTLPWAITPEHVRQAYNAALLSGDGNALNLSRTIRTVLDDLHLADTPALARFCVPLVSDAACLAHERVQDKRTRMSSANIRVGLSDRKTPEKLPEERAFWEMVRIVFTETPRTFLDAIRFAVLKLAIITGLRIGEIILLPFDCLRWREYFDSDRRPSGINGGHSRSLMLRYFAEKQVEKERAGGICLYENAQHVPPMFDEIVLDTVSAVARWTAPLRERLRGQIETGRLFPEYPPDALVTAHEMYTRLTGNAMFSYAKVPTELLARYRHTLDPTVLDEIRDIQLAGGTSLKPTSSFWLRPANTEPIAIRNSVGDIMDRVVWRDAFVLIGEVEAYVRANTPTKIPDLAPAVLTDGSLFHPHELMFLKPSRTYVECRHDGLIDPTRYFASSHVTLDDMHRILDGSEPESFFRRYGAEEEDRRLRLKPHALRHLQNTELFRLGVADTIITKRFNRRSVAQSYEYDHRSLAEDLANIDVPEQAESTLSDNARQVYRMIAGNKVSGPIISEFHRIQREHGDDVAFEYLNAEADGLHVTPYGFCVNSFAVDPCPKHLECFNGCRHLARSDVEEERHHLERLRDRMAGVLQTLEALPEHQRSAGWHNQIGHARTRLANIVTALDARPGEKPFPNGPDLHQAAARKWGTTVLDTVTLMEDDP